MPGEPTLPNEHYPDYFQILSIPFHHALLSPSNDIIPLMYVEPRATNGTGIVVDSIVYGIAVDEGSSDTLQVIHGITPDTTGGTAIQSAGIPLNSNGTFTATINTNNNFVPAGSWLIMKASTTLGQVHGCVTIRFRSRLK